MGRKIRCGIIGYGYMGEIRQRVIERHPDLKLVGICETDPSKRSALPPPYLIDDPAALISASDAVFVCTPNKYSPEFTIQSLNAGKHVFCEKPPGRNLEDIRAIIRAERPETRLMFGFNHRFHPGIIKAKVLVDSGRMGRIIGLRGIYGKSGGSRYAESWRNNREISGGGILLDQGIHMLDLFNYFCGQFESVKCFAGQAFWKFDVEDNAFVILQNDKGQAASLHSSATLWRHTFRIDIILEHGYIVVDGLLSKSGSYGREKMVVGRRQFEEEAAAVGNPSEEVTYFDHDLSWELEIDEFASAIQENRPVTVSSSQDALHVMDIIDRAYRDAGLVKKKEWAVR